MRSLSAIRRRLVNRALDAAAPVVGRLCLPDMGRFAWLRFVPSRPQWARRVGRAPVWATEPHAVPPELRTVPGNPVDASQAEAAFREHPLHSFTRLHHEAFGWLIVRNWHILIPSWPRLLRAQKLDMAVRATRAKDVAPPEM